jgi:hypothetical protein
MVSFVMGWLSATQNKLATISGLCSKIGDYRWRGLSGLVKCKPLPPTAHAENNRRAPIGSGLSDRSIGALTAALLHKTRSLPRFSNNRHCDGRECPLCARNRADCRFDTPTKPFVLGTRPLVTNPFRIGPAGATVRADQTSKSLVAAFDFTSRDSADAKRYD